MHFLADRRCACSWCRLGAASASRAGRDAIVVTAEQVAQARAAAAVLQGREPTPEELDALVEPTIRDEVLYREALALGLDENDDEVRARLIEKMNYLTQDLADPEPSSAEALRQFYDANARALHDPVARELRSGVLQPRHARRPARGRCDGRPRGAARGTRSGERRRSHAAARVLRRCTARAGGRVVRRCVGRGLVRRCRPASGRARSDPISVCTRCGCAAAAKPRLPPYDEIAARVAEEFGAQRRREANERAYQADARALRRRHRAAGGRARGAGAGPVMRAVRCARCSP